MTLFFLHIPRTGGTALRNAFANALGRDKVLSLYSKNGPETSPIASQIFHPPDKSGIAERFAALSRHIAANEVDLFTSHHSSAQLDCFDPGRSFVILRDPVDRIISEYRFRRHLHGFDVPFEEFVSNPDFQNLQSKILRGTKLQNVGVFGIFDEYDDFVRRLNDKFDLCLRVESLNETRLLSRRFVPFLTPSSRAKIEGTNQDDCKLYTRARKLLSANRGADQSVNSNGGPQRPT